MAATRRGKRDVMHTHLVLRVVRYEGGVNASVNPYAYEPQYAWDLDDSDPVYEFTAQLTITAISTAPDDRAGNTYELTIYGDDSPRRRHHSILRDVQARDQYGSPQYRQYRGKQVPVFNPPRGLAVLNKIRGEPRWTAWLFVPVRSVSDMLQLFNHGRTLFLAVHERQENRARWVQSVTLQTIDPMTEE
jgi:hypothetical protein